MPMPPDRLYHLLPAIHRQRDLAQGEPLRTFMGILEQELLRMEADINGLYENWFIETCEPWVIPYIADLLGIDSLGDEAHLLYDQRAYVANTIAYRRRKGTVAVIENVTADVTGWPAQAVEFRDRVSTSQHLQHQPHFSNTSFDIRDTGAIHQLNSPLSPSARLLDTRRITSPHSSRGLHNPLNLGVFVWRLRSYPITRSLAHPHPDGYFTFHPLGADMALFTYPQAKGHVTERSDEFHLPIPLSPTTFAADLDNFRQRFGGLSVAAQPGNSQYYGRDRSLYIQLKTADGDQPIPPSVIVSADLSGDFVPEAGTVAVDVTLGRFAFAASEQPDGPIEVNYNYGFSADIGGGPYYRPLTQSASLAWQGTVVRAGTPEPLPEGTFATLQAAVESWQQTRSFQRQGIIRLVDNGLYDATSLAIDLPAGSQLTIEAVNGVCPHIQAQGAIGIRGTGALSTLSLNGLVIQLQGKEAQLQAQGRMGLHLEHCTVIGGLGVASDQTAELEYLQISIAQSIVGPLRLPQQVSRLVIEDSIVDNRLVHPGNGGHGEGALDEEDQEVGQSAIAAPAPDLAAPPTTICRSTIFGKVHLSELVFAENVIFTDLVYVERRQVGAVRFSYVPSPSRTPQRYRCQPDLAISDGNESTRDRILQSLKPRFTATHYGHPAYAQLRQDCPPAIATGASNDSEMGVFYQLNQPQRSAYLRLSLEEYIPAGLETDVIYLT